MVKRTKKEAAFTPKPQLELNKIHTRTSVYTPEKAMPGELVVICTWLGAAPKHIAKYTEMYKIIAPGAHILLIESSVSILVSSYAHQRRMIQPAVDMVLAVLGQSNFKPAWSSKAIAAITDIERPPPRILLHTFSNGGSNTATQLLLVLSQQTGMPLPLTGIMLDSCPAKGTYWKSYDAMVLSLPKDVLTRVLGAIMVHSLLLLLYTWIACGNENPASLMRRTLLSDRTVRESSWPSSAKVKGRACYLYSKNDKMCEWSDITHHAEDARRMGWYVREVEFENSAHCAHYGTNQAVYTEAAREMWEPEITSVRQRRELARL